MCGCGCQSARCNGMGFLGLSILAPVAMRAAGLRGLGNVKAGSEGRLGMEFDHLFFRDTNRYVFIRDSVQGCLYATGDFAYIRVTIQEGTLNDYLLVNFTVSRDFAFDYEIREVIERTVRECTDIAISSVDQLLIDKRPEDPNLPKATVQTPSGGGGGDGSPSKPDKCKFDDKGREREGLDYIGCKLGLSSPSLGSSGLLIGIIAAVVIAKALK